ncbi:MAG TPA: hypothetical protein VFQ35_25585 [Polyangiaceae bacterium]|nr:hypothetical protein [Polyangiaceae bacterium]
MPARTHAPTLVLSLCLAACSALGGGDTGLRDELAASRAEAQAEHERVQELEQRLAQLELNSKVQVRDRRIEARLERLIDQNEALLRAQSAPACQPSAPQSTTEPSRPPTGTASFADATEGDQKKQLEERLRAFVRGQGGGLSAEQREAMRVLLRKDRVLDRANPWHDN